MTWPKSTLSCSLNLIENTNKDQFNPVSSIHTASVTLCFWHVPQSHQIISINQSINRKWSVSNIAICAKADKTQSIINQVTFVYWLTTPPGHRPTDWRNYKSILKGSFNFLVGEQLVFPKSFQEKHKIPKCMCEDWPMQGVSPTRPSILFSIPPVEVAQDMFPSLSTATAPTVPIFPLYNTTAEWF